MQKKVLTLFYISDIIHINPIGVIGKGRRKDEIFNRQTLQKKFLYMPDYGYVDVRGLLLQKIS